MFKPSEPNEGADASLEIRSAPPSVFAVSHSLLGLMFVCAGTVGFFYGGLLEHQASPEAGEGLLAGLFSGLAARLGETFQRLGQVLLASGLPLAIAGWGLLRQKSWARLLTRLLGLLAAVAGFWLLMRMAWLEAVLSLGYAGLVGWVLGWRRP